MGETSKTALSRCIDFVNIAQELAREQSSTRLLVTHDDRILDIADRIVHMGNGRLVNNLINKAA